MVVLNGDAYRDMADICWKTVGVWGDRTCPQLAPVTHCQNCSVYSKAGRSLLDRAAPPDYLQSWTELLAQPRSRQQEQAHDLSVMVFRLGREWVGIGAGLFKQVVPPVPVHTLPHRSNAILRGIINVQGEILLCISLHALLGLEDQPAAAAPVAPEANAINPVVYPRLVVIAQQGETWAFAVDELYGVHRCARQQLHAPPTVATQAAASVTQGILHWRDRQVSYLHTEQLFERLRQDVL